MTRPIRIFDSYSRRVVDLQPVVPGQVSMYLCGPTVQAAPHIGHARSAIAFDVVRRYLAWAGYKVTFVRNITDVEDKIIKRANDEGISAREVSERYAAEYREAMLAVGCAAPDLEPLVTQTMPEILSLIQKLIDEGKAYPASGDVYYAVDSFPPYGALSGQSIADLQAGARVEVGEQKRNPLDFALWKGAKPGEPWWESPWGNGRPGWHIECSAMIYKTVGRDIDLHGGGRDLIFPHHENEIAQSVGAFGPGSFARVWMHNGLLNLGTEKMSKSIGNVLGVAEMCKVFDGESIRAYLVQHHYRSPINFEVEERDGKPVFPGIEEADRRLDYFYSTLGRIDDFLGEKRDVEPGGVIAEAERLVSAAHTAMSEDFNTSVTMAELGEAARAANKLLDDPKGVAKDVRRRSIARLGRDLRDTGRGALGLLGQEPRAFLQARRARLCQARGIDGAAIDQRLRDRDDARKAKDFTRADAIRAELRERGIEVMDTPRGAEWRVSEPA
jgi:cysteinyl-tRNA synthetase